MMDSNRGLPSTRLGGGLEFRVASRPAVLGTTATVACAPSIAGNLTCNGRGAEVKHAIYGTHA